MTVLAAKTALRTQIYLLTCLLNYTGITANTCTCSRLLHFGLLPIADMRLMFHSLMMLVKMSPF